MPIVTCPSCQQSVSAGDRFCGHCGARVFEDLPPPLKQQSSPPAQTATPAVTPQATTVGKRRLVIGTLAVAAISTLVLVLFYTVGPYRDEPIEVLRQASRAEGPSGTIQVVAGTYGGN